MNKEKILFQGKKAIEYFDFKKQFAKNKEWHAVNIQKLEKLYNYAKLPYSNKPIVDALLLELYMHKLLELKNEHFAIKNIAEIIQFPKERKYNVLDILKSNIIFKRLETEKLTIDNINTILKVENINNYINEIITVLNQDL